MDSIQLFLDTQIYTGWTRWRVERGLEQLAGSFELSVVQPLTTAFPASISPGASVKIMLNEDPLIAGYIDERSFSLDSESLSIGITGRDKTADLVDCSVVHPSGQFKLPTLTALATELAQPFGISVVSRMAHDAKIPRLNVEQGETVFELLERVARAQNALLTTNGNGDMVLIQAEQFSSLGRINLSEAMKIERHDSHQDRHSEYRMLGQNPNMEDSDEEATNRVKPSAGAKDSGIKRYRPLVLMAEEHNSDMAKRANWEMRTRKGRSLRWTLTLAGHRTVQGLLWQPGYLIAITSQQNWIPDTLLISRVVWQWDEQGATTELELTLPDAYLPEPLSHKDTGNS